VSLAACPQVKSRQLKKLFEKYQGKKAELSDLQEQFQQEREGLLEDYRILTQQVRCQPSRRGKALSQVGAQVGRTGEMRHVVVHPCGRFDVLVRFDGEIR
jgi:hypothetical protein